MKNLIVALFLMTSFILVSNNAKAQDSDWFEEGYSGFCESMLDAVDDLKWVDPNIRAKIEEGLRKCAKKAVVEEEKTGSTSKGIKKFQYSYQKYIEEVYEKYGVELPRKLG